MIAPNPPATWRCSAKWRPDQIVAVADARLVGVGRGQHQTRILQPSTGENVRTGLDAQALTRERPEIDGIDRRSVRGRQVHGVGPQEDLHISGGSQVCEVDVTEPHEGGDLEDGAPDRGGPRQGGGQPHPFGPDIGVVLGVGDAAIPGRPLPVRREHYPIDRPARDGEVITDLEVDRLEGPTETGPVVGGAAQPSQPGRLERQRIGEALHRTTDALATGQGLSGLVGAADTARLDHEST